MIIRILSWNVHGLPFPITRYRRQRMRRIAQRIEAERPDVALLQEVWAGAIGALAGELRSYTIHYIRTALGNAAGGLVALVRSGGDLRIEESALAFRRFSKSGPRHRFWEGDGFANKGALFLSLVRGNGARIHFVDTHLQSRYGPLDYRETRLAQVGELAFWIDALGFDAPVFIAGDFNTPADSDPVYEHLESVGIDLTGATREVTGAATNYPLHTTAAWIDYVLMRPFCVGTQSSVQIIENERPDHPYSDHSALLAHTELVDPTGWFSASLPQSGRKQGPHPSSSHP